MKSPFSISEWFTSVNNDKRLPKTVGDVLTTYSPYYRDDGHNTYLKVDVRKIFPSFIRPFEYIGKLQLLNSPVMTYRIGNEILRLPKGFPPNRLLSGGHFNINILLTLISMGMIFGGDKITEFTTDTARKDPSFLPLKNILRTLNWSEIEDEDALKERFVQTFGTLEYPGLINVVYVNLSLNQRQNPNILFSEMVMNALGRIIVREDNYWPQFVDQITK